MGYSIMHRIIICLMILIVHAFPAVAQEAKEKKRKPGFTVGKDTTFVDGPLDKGGYIDYVAAINQHLSKGVTPENNANVLLWQAFGPRLDGAVMSAKFFEWMKIPAPPEKGDYFLLPGQFLTKRLKVEGLEHGEKFYQATEAAQSRPWKSMEHPDVAQWLNANEKPLALVVAATKRAQYFSPLVPNERKDKFFTYEGVINVRVAGPQGCRQFAASLTARAMLRLGEGRTDEAWQDLLACHRLGRLVGRGGTGIESFVGIASNRSHANRNSLSWPMPNWTRSSSRIACAICKLYLLGLRWPTKLTSRNGSCSLKR